MGDTKRPEVQSAPLDPLDAPSDVYVMRDGKMVELSFRELSREALLGQGHMALMDSISQSMRLAHEKANDPHYRRIKPNAGKAKLRPVHRWWRP